MSRNSINLVVFLAGLCAACWIGFGYIGTNPLAFAVTFLIVACYLSGAWELQRYQQATATLVRAVTELSGPPPSLAAWLERLHPSLGNAVRQRIENERAALPGPTLAPYLVGLLVLLGMLGTLLGMVTTLHGTGTALESAMDIETVRATLAAPVKGLGFAFGTSIAGVATSAMLGLLSALCRRERILAAQMLDQRIATTLRSYSQTHQREETLRLLQRQAEAMPVLVDRLQAMMAAIERQNEALNERHAAHQEAFYNRVEAAYDRLASSVAQSLKASVAESARVASTTLQPIVDTTMQSLARETTTLHGTIKHAVDQQLHGLAAGFEASTAAVANVWSQALAEHQKSSEALATRLSLSLDQFNETLTQRTGDLLEGVSARLEAAADSVSGTWNQSLSQQERINERLADRNERALAVAAATFEQNAASLIGGVDRSHRKLQEDLASQDRQRLVDWTQTLGSMVTTLSAQWEQINALTASRQKEICDTLARTAQDISAQTKAHASDTIAEISGLVQAASEAPKAAAEIIGELREKLSESMARDTAMLEERTRLLETLQTLLDAVNHASSQQREAVDSLIATSAGLLDRVGAQFSNNVQAHAEKLGAVTAQVTASAVEVASLGEAFGAAVQSFGESNDKLLTHLSRIETALDKSLSRSDEQLAYYVAQAKEVIELSMLSQQRIVEEMQQVSGRETAA
ncbi:hypothetical protein C9I57_21215 [Trinickia symbiotica]|uniref:DUF802 domain-containing protein n=1 Tax=Trinickia symbiotica TaxID=863227 RepID=A0A2T3XR48_9BURK|nr:DUF802 domain-containing protein [Trinickia symbiotica]PTB18999.1 hypothetical protein C9I57_21215 [Trinickia symbiotica]